LFLTNCHSECKSVVKEPYQYWANNITTSQTSKLHRNFYWFLGRILSSHEHCNKPWKEENIRHFSVTFSFSRRILFCGITYSFNCVWCSHVLKYYGRTNWLNIMQAKEQYVRCRLNLHGNHQVLWCWAVAEACLVLQHTGGRTHGSYVHVHSGDKYVTFLTDNGRWTHQQPGSGYQNEPRWTCRNDYYYCFVLFWHYQMLPSQDLLKQIKLCII